VDGVYRIEVDWDSGSCATMNSHVSPFLVAMLTASVVMVVATVVLLASAMRHFRTTDNNTKRSDDDTVPVVVERYWEAFRQQNSEGSRNDSGSLESIPEAEEFVCGLDRDEIVSSAMQDIDVKDGFEEV
jgi:hypothetical protein